MSTTSESEKGSAVFKYRPEDFIYEEIHRASRVLSGGVKKVIEAKKE